MVQKHVLLEHFKTLSPKWQIFRSTEVADETMKNNLGCSFKTLLALENGIVFQYRSYTFIKIHIWKYYQRFSIRNYRCLICILSCTSFSQIILKMKSWSFQHSFLWSFCSPSPAGILKNTQNIFKQDIYILVFETIQNIFSLSCFPLHPHKSRSLATEIVFLSKKTKPCFSQRQNWPAREHDPIWEWLWRRCFLRDTAQ